MVQAKCLSEIVSILLDGMGDNADAAADAAANSSAVAALLAEPDTRGAGEIVFTSWFTYFVIGYFLVSVGFWLYRLQSALSKYDPLFIIPLLQASYIVFATIGGAAWLKLPPSSPPASPPPLQGAPDGSGRLSTPRGRAQAHGVAPTAASGGTRASCLLQSRPTPLPMGPITMQAAGSTSKSCRRWRRISGSSSQGASSSCS